MLSIETFLSGRLLKCLLTQVAGCVNSEVEKQRKRIYMLKKKKVDGTSKNQLQSLIRRIKQNIPSKPNLSKINPEINTLCADFQSTDGEYNEFVQLKCLVNTQRGKVIRCPIKHHRHFKSLQLKCVRRLSSILLTTKTIQLR